MMRNTIMMLGCALAPLGVVPAAAETVEIPLPELHGHYSIDGTTERETDFAFIWETAGIEGAFVRVAGTATMGSVICVDPTPVPYPLEVLAYMRDDVTGGYYIDGDVPFEDVGGPFEVMLELRPSLHNPPGWDFLADGTGNMLFNAMPVSLIGICGPVIAYPEAEITEVTLIFEMSLVVGTDLTPWGTVKSLYRPAPEPPPAR